MADAEAVRGRIQRAVVRLIADAVLFNHAVAQRVGLGASDAQFMTLLQVHGALLPSQLAALTRLTTGTVTGVLDRLERAGLIQRTRDERDRRKVTVSAREDTVATLLAPHYRAQAERLDALLRTRSPEDLAVIADFLAELLAQPGSAGGADQAAGEGAQVVGELGRADDVEVRADAGEVPGEHLE